FLDFRNQLPQCTYKCFLRKRAVVLAEAVSPVFGAHSPEAGEHKRRGQLRKTDVRMPVALAPKRQYGVWAGINPAGDPSREVNSQERETRVGDWINKRTQQGSALGNKIVIFAAEGNNPDFRIVSRYLSNAVAEQSRAVDDRGGRKRAAWSFDDHFAGVPLDGRSASAGENSASVFGDEFRIFLTYLREVCNTGGRDMQGEQACGVGLEFPEFFGADSPDTGEAVCFSATSKLFQARQFFLTGGDDHLSADFVRDVVLAAEVYHLLRTGYAEPCL